MTKPTGKFAALANAKKQGGILIPELQKVALKSAGGGHPGGNDHIHPSEMSKADWCPRATYYRLNTGKVFDDKFSFILENIFDEGNEIHAKWQRRMRETKKLWGSWRCLTCKQWRHQCFEPGIAAGGMCYDKIIHHWEYMEVPLEDKESLIWGHEDGAMALESAAPEDDMLPGGYMVELKSIGLGTVRVDAAEKLKKYYVETTDGDRIYNLNKFWKDLKRPFLSHVKQANIYLWLSERMGLPFTEVRFLYEFKANQQVKEFVIKKSDRILEPLLTMAKGVVYALESGTPPVCPNVDDQGNHGCKACRKYEEELDAPQENSARSAPGEPGDAPGEPVPARGSKRRRTPPEVSGDRRRPVGEAPRKRPARRTTGPDGGTRPGPDEHLPGGPAVGEVPGASASSGRGRRVLRRKGSNPD